MVVLLPVRSSMVIFDRFYLLLSMWCGYTHRHGHPSRQSATCYREESIWNIRS